ncbi:MAG: hypothetical protein ACJAQT_005332 [Akkermansiaceae bacterium]|jgi:hypothetical protein
MKIRSFVRQWFALSVFWFASAMPGNAQLSSPQPPAKFVEITENGSEVEVSGVAGRFYQPQCSLDLVQWFDLGDRILREGVDRAPRGVVCKTQSGPASGLRPQ